MSLAPNPICQRTGCEKPSLWTPVFTVHTVQGPMEVCATISFCEDCRDYALEKILPDLIQGEGPLMSFKLVPSQATRDLRDELLEEGIPKDVAEVVAEVWGESLITPEILEEQRRKNELDAHKLDLRERMPPNIFYPGDWRPPLWLRIVAPFYEMLRNIWRRVRRS